MRAFLTAPDAAFADLERRGRSAGYIQFQNEELPPGCVPGRARIGVKVDSTSGASTLFIDRGIRYYGSNRTIRRWVQDGQIIFTNFAEFRLWIRSDLSKAFDSPEIGLGRPIASLGEAVHASAPPGQESSSGGSSSVVQPLLEPVLKSLIVAAVRQIGRNYDVDVQSIDEALLLELRDKIKSNCGQASSETVLDDVLGGPLALAALQEHRTISVHVGPPIHCRPSGEKKNE